MIIVSNWLWDSELANLKVNRGEDAEDSRRLENAIYNINRVHFYISRGVYHKQSIVQAWLTHSRDIAGSYIWYGAILHISHNDENWDKTVTRTDILNIYLRSIESCQRKGFLYIFNFIKIIVLKVNSQVDHFSFCYFE